MQPPLRGHAKKKKRKEDARTDRQAESDRQHEDSRRHGQMHHGTVHLG